MKLISSAFILLSYILNLNAQSFEKYTISGYVREAVSGESLIGVNIYLPESKSGTVTNNYGFYSITLPASNKVELVVSYVGFTPDTLSMDLNKDIELNIDLKPSIILGEVTVSAEHGERQSESARMSSVKIDVAQVKNLPSLLGEKDILKVIQLMPGVQKGTEGSSGFYVRGGGPDQNLIILDDAVVYNASHLFGFFSIFNGDALKSAELTKGGFPARYGGRLSSVLEMNMKDGNKEEWHGEGGIGLISSRMTLEGPLRKDKSSILISGRRTYADLILKPLLLAMEAGNTGYFFHDFNAKVNYDFGRKNKLYLSGYFGKDKFYIKNNRPDVKENAGFLWTNATGTLRWNHLFSNKLFSNTSLIYSNYSFGIYDNYKVISEKKNFYSEYNSGIRDFSLKYDIDYIPGTNHLIKAGFISTYHRFRPYAFAKINEYPNFNIKDFRTIDGFESAIYIEDTWQPVQNFKINGGVRYSHFLASTQQYHNLEPRLSAAWRLRSDFALKASYSEMNQYIHLVSNTGISLPTDLWVPATDRISPQDSRQVAAGFAKDLRKPEIAISVEAYYKTMNNVLGYKEGATFLEFDSPESSAGINWEDNVTSGRAWSYGAEFMVQKKTGRLSGWLGYTLSWTQMQFDSLNFGRKFYARYDRRHDISVVGIYKINDRITISATWVYGTGNALTLPTSSYNVLRHIDSHKNPPHPTYDFKGTIVKDYGDKNNFRMDPYHRLDAGIQFHKQKKHWERIWEFSVYNAYNRKNPFYYYTENIIKNNKEYGILRQVSLFQVIPSFSYSIKF
jgi:hypothetical protein